MHWEQSNVSRSSLHPICPAGAGVAAYASEAASSCIGAGPMTVLPRTPPVALRELHEPSPYDLIGLLDATRERLVTGADVALAVDILSDGLWWMRTSFPAPRWLETISIARAHPVSGLLHEDPLIRRAFTKPRGYPGDAPLMDLVYGDITAVDAHDTSPLGLALLERSVLSPASIAMRECRDFVATLIDHMADVRSEPSILAAACGHLREGMVSQAVQRCRLGRLVALDADAEALAVVTRELGSKGVETLNGNVKVVIEDALSPCSFDLIFATGLYEYLPDHFAAPLTTGFINILSPGGRLIITNPVQNPYDAGYIEAFGDWFKIYRSASELMDLAAFPGAQDIALQRVYTRQSPDMLYLEIRKRFSPEL